MVFHFPTWPAKGWWLFTLDILLNAAILTPLTVTLWVSTWELLFNLVVLIAGEENLNVAFWIVLASGSFIVLFIYLIQYPIQPCVSSESFGPAFQAVFLRGEMYVIFMARMAVWVSMWDIIGASALNSWLALVIGLTGLCCLQSLNSGVSMPMNLHLDSQQKPCNQKTRFGVNPLENDGSLKQKLLYAIDALVTALVIEYLIIAAWRGAFNILDLYLLPDSPTLSAWVTVIIGYNMFWLLVVFQFPASKISKKLDSTWKRVLWELAYWLYAFILMTCLWRGFWNVIIIFTHLKTVSEPHNFTVSFAMHIVSSLVALGLNMFVSARIPLFTAADGALADGSGVLVKNYLRPVSVSF